MVRERPVRLIRSIVVDIKLSTCKEIWKVGSQQRYGIRLALRRHRTPLSRTGQSPNLGWM